MLTYSKTGTFAYGVLVAYICRSRENRLSGWIDGAKVLDCPMAAAMRLDRDTRGMLYLNIEKTDVNSSRRFGSSCYTDGLAFSRLRSVERASEPQGYGLEEVTNCINQLAFAGTQYDSEDDQCTLA
jgi:hypothetical protein